MKNFILSFTLLFFLLPGLLLAQDENSSTQKYFAFGEIYNQEINVDYSTKRLNSFDGVQIAYYQFEPDTTSIATLVFIHGGGAASSLGYLQLAQTLSEQYAVNTILMDLRGHGESAGRRGDAPSMESVFIDITTLLNHVKRNDQPLYLGGHSSGAGTVLNYSSSKEIADVDGYFFISPYLGENANTVRKDPVHFFDMDIEKFINNAKSGGVDNLNDYAVFFNYPPAILRAEPSLVTALTVCMANATTPYNAHEQFKGITKPIGLFIGSDDEIFDAEKVIAFDQIPTERNAASKAKILKNSNHLSILNEIGPIIGETIWAWNN